VRLGVFVGGGGGGGGGDANCCLYVGGSPGVKTRGAGLG